VSIWSKLLDWATGNLDGEDYHDPAYLAAHAGDEGYFTRERVEADYAADSDESGDEAGDDFTPDGA
jgi:hypothetical protein